ncbi:hypothetical protein PAP_05735 [Palaeococcus pacificus DY20341]|uniref:Metal-binding protein n=1 Tax=Palaeococcus pacificus DY20341 TaxID=1343739 RepID=A0A075LU98_9EURY|nr:DUF2284 domain-containing protein [Palaeococcus pacificus]AIF69547.1 hypothetical protein PAP_05735 [Palaeococcus pacificus DY20341]
MRIISEREISAGDIVISPRPIWKCRACPMYGKSPSCPPHTPSWKEAKEWVGHFKKALLIKFEIDYENFDREKRDAINYLLKKEEEFFKAGYYYAFGLFPGNCNLCEECSFQRNGECSMPTKVRPSLDAIGIELFKLVKIDFNESVLYGLILID